MEPISILDFEAIARSRMEATAFDYFRSGADGESTLANNQSAYDQLQLHYRVLVDVSNRCQETVVLGRKLSMPILVAPTAFHKLANRDGETATARAAGKAGTVMILSTLSNSPMEEVVEATSGPVWFQLYVYRDRGATKALVARAEAAGCEALVLTVDAPLLGRRLADVRNRFHLPPGLSVENLLPAGLGDLPHNAPTSGLASYFAELLDPSLSWKDLEWLRSITSLPLLLKGVVRSDDALRAAEYGAAGVVVSNHGGRQLDTSPATIEVLEEISQAVAGQLDVFVDGGIRRGTDVVKALALGARAVLVGRPVLWGLAAQGAVGVERILSLFREELDLAMALCGTPTLADITRDLVRKAP